MLARVERRVLLMALLMVLGLVWMPPSMRASAGEDGRTIDWGLSGCRGLVVLVPTSPESLEAHLPAGFTATMPDSVAELLPPDPRLEAVLGLEVLDCEEGAGLHGPVQGLDYASFWTFVEPPEGHDDRGHDLSFVKWDTLVPDEPRRDLLVDHGLAARDGEVSFDLWSPLDPGAGVGFDAGWTFADGETYRFIGAAAVPVDFNGSFVEYAPASVGLAEWETSYRSASAFGGQGLAELDADGWPAEVLGDTLVDAYFLVPSDLDFYDATITLPPGSRAPAAARLQGGRQERWQGR